jgi:hypothetical protein
MDPGIAHQQSFERLLRVPMPPAKGGAAIGNATVAALVRAFSVEERAAALPPLFLWHSLGDAKVPPQHSLRLFDARVGGGGGGSGEWGGGGATPLLVNTTEEAAAAVNGFARERAHGASMMLRDGRGDALLLFRDGAHGTWPARTRVARGRGQSVAWMAAALPWIGQQPRNG